MKNKVVTFLIDPKQWLAIIALVVSIIALRVGCVNQIDQDRRWDITLLGTLTLTQTSFIPWKIVSEKEFRETRWGYELRPVGTSSDSSSELQYQLLYALRFADDENKPVKGSNPFFTADEQRTEMARFRQAHPDVHIPQEGFPLTKHYVLNLCFEIDGSTRVIDVEATATMEDPYGAESKELLRSKYPFTVSPGRAKNFHVELFVPYKFDLPDKSVFHVVATYTDAHNKRKSLYVDIDYYRATNRWEYLLEQTKIVSNIATTPDR